MTRILQLSSSRRRRRAGLLLLLVAGAVVATILLAPWRAAPAPSTSVDRGPAAATPLRAAADEPLASGIVDAALLPPGGADRAPRVLTVRPDDELPGRVHLTVLERGAGRWSARAAAVDEPPIIGQTSTPWLLALDDHRFVLLALAPELGETWLRTVTWTGEELHLGPRAAVSRQADAAGTADVDGDGTPEVVLAEARTRRAGPTCQGSMLSVLEVPGLTVVDELTIPDIRLDATAVGDLDDVPGADLVASSYRNCPAGPASPARLLLVAIRLRDGRLLTERPLEAADVLTAWSGRPAVVDADGDTRPEVLVGGSRGLLVLEPRAAWRTSRLADAAGVLLGAVSRPDAAGADVVVGSADGGAIGRIGRDGGSWSLRRLTALPRSAVGEAGFQAAAFDVRASAIRSGGGAGWLDSPDACPTLVVSLALAPCDADAAGPGPAWIATRPLARLTAAGDRLLVAQTDTWPSVPARLVAPSPLAAERPGTGWRHGPSEPFSLVEVPGGPIGAGHPEGAAEAPAPTSDGFASGRPLEVGLGAARGSRLVASVAAGRGPTSPAGPVEARNLPQLLAVPSRAGSTLDLVRVPPSGAVRLALPPAAGDDARWSVALAAIGPLGDVSEVVRRDVVVDVVVPRLAVDDAFLRAPWPFTTSLTGRSEPGAVVTAGGEAVTVGPDGRFSLAARLAPWPQRLELRVADAAGNEQAIGLDLVGGPDVRRLPWIWILAVALVAGAALGSLRGRGRGNGAPWDGPAIEDLDVPDLR